MADAPQQQPEPTYAHPAAAFFLVFFKASAVSRARFWGAGARCGAVWQRRTACT